MTSLPDWLVERAALDEVPAASRERIDRADPRELADRVATLRDANAAELAAHPVGAAVAQIEARVAAVRRSRSRRRIALVGLAGSTALALAVAIVVIRPAGQPAAALPDEITRVKGSPRLLAFRQAGDHPERLEEDAVVRAGDVIQLRYNAGGQRYGVIVSIDGAGVATLHYPASEEAPARATALAAETTALPHAYALDAAPRYERFFFITANAPIDVQHAIGELRAFARRGDAADASLDLPSGLRQWSLRLRKPDNQSP